LSWAPKASKRLEAVPWDAVEARVLVRRSNWIIDVNLSICWQLKLYFCHIPAYWLLSTFSSEIGYLSAKSHLDIIIDLFLRLRHAKAPCFGGWSRSQWMRWLRLPAAEAEAN
jgi:hypothetical protein